LFNAEVTPDAPSDYRVAPALAARLLGLGLALLGLLVLMATVLVAAVGLPAWTLAMLAAVGVGGLAAAGWWLTWRARVVRLDEVGYRVRFVRGSGVPAARWKDVLDAGTRRVAGSPCVVVRLRDGRTTTIPADVLAADSEALAADVQAHLRRGHGLGPL